MPSKRALIVDDSSTAQYRLKKMLRPYPLVIDAVDSGEAALRYLASNVPDVIFMDHLMPGMDGFRALQIIKSHPETAMIPVIMYTSKSGDVYVGQARALGALDVVNKDSINATNLSKVMQAIHIYPDSDTHTNSSTPRTESAELVAAANQADPDTHQIERRTPTPTSIEQARNLELRLSHLEHTLEDNRRFITSRVVRELQGLRQNLRQEFSDIISNNPPPPTAISAEAETPPLPEKGNILSTLSKIVMVIVLAVIAIYLAKMSTTLTQTQQQQTQLQQQLQIINAQKNPEQSSINPAATADNSELQTTLLAQKYADDAYLADITWAFNQSGSLPFNQNNIDPKAVIRVYELLNRMISNGFRGSAWITIYVGDYCVTMDAAGQAQLPAEDITLNGCMMSSELYGIERVAENYSREMQSALANLGRNQAKVVHIMVDSTPGPDTYPERLPTLTAKEWNTIAQNNNRIEVRVESSGAP